MEVTLSHKESTLQAVNPYLKKEKKETNPSINIVASLSNTIQKLALIREQITKCANIEEQIKLVSDLDMNEILNLRKLLEKTYEKNYGDKTKDAIEVLETKYTEKELDDIHAVRGAIPAITTLASRKSFEGVETPLHCIVYLWKNFEVYSDLYQMKVALKELWDRKEILDRLSQPTFQGQLETITGQYKTIIEEVSQSLEAIATCYTNIVQLTKLSDNVEKLLELLDNLPLFEEIQQNMEELLKVNDLKKLIEANTNSIIVNKDEINALKERIVELEKKKDEDEIIEEPTQLTNTPNNTNLFLNKRPRNPYQITYDTNADSVNLSVNPENIVNVSLNDKVATITPLTAGQVTITARATASETDTHRYTESITETNLTINPLNEFQRLYKDDFTTLNTNNNVRDNVEAYTILGGPISQWSGNKAVAQLQNCLILKDGIDKYRGLLFQCDNQYVCAGGYFNPNDNKYYMYGIYGMNLAICKCDKETSTFYLSPTPSNTYSLFGGSVVFVRFLPIENRWRLRITILKSDNTIQSGNNYDLQYTLPAGMNPLLLVSQGWQGGNQTVICRKPVGILKDSQYILQSVTNDDCAALRQKWDEALNVDVD